MAMAPSPIGDNLLNIRTPANSTANPIGHLPHETRDPPEIEKAPAVVYNDASTADSRESKLTVRKFMVLLAMSFLWVASQVPLYLYGAVIPLIIRDIGGADRAVWISLSNFIPLAAVTPFVGQLSDVVGRRHLSLVAAIFLIVGNVVCSTCQTMNIFIAGMALIGIGAGVLEMTALAVAGEMAPVQKRGLYIGSVILTVLPYAPSVLYAQFVSVHSWRYLGAWIGAWTFVGLVLTALFFFPRPRPSTGRLTRKQILGQIDYIGGLLSTAGFTLFLAGLTWAGGQYPWTSVHVLLPLILGIVLVIAFGFWEVYGVSTPMFPQRLNQRSPRALATVLIVTAASGGLFFTILVWWPTQYSYMYAATGDPLSVGLGSLPIAFCFLGGSVVVSFLISYFPSRMKLFLVTSCVVMTAANGALAAATLENLQPIFAALVLSCFGCGAVIVPCQIIASIISPDDLVATAIALTITIRFVGGAVANAIYFSVQTQKFAHTSVEYISAAAARAGIISPEGVQEIILLILSNAWEQVRKLVQTDEQFADLVYAGRQAYASSYPIVYYCGVGFGALAVLASCFLPDISPFIDSHVAVKYT